MGGLHCGTGAGLTDAPVSAPVQHQYRDQRGEKQRGIDGTRRGKKKKHRGVWFDSRKVQSRSITIQYANDLYRTTCHSRKDWTSWMDPPFQLHLKEATLSHLHHLTSTSATYLSPPCCPNYSTVCSIHLVRRHG